MRIRQKLTKSIHDTNELCFRCKKATGGCAWSRSFDPVEGWTAEPTRTVYRVGYEENPRMLKQSYHITACPEFEEG